MSETKTDTLQSFQNKVAGRMYRFFDVSKQTAREGASFVAPTTYASEAELMLKVANGGLLKKRETPLPLTKKK